MNVFFGEEDDDYEEFDFSLEEEDGGGRGRAARTGGAKVSVWQLQEV